MKTQFDDPIDDRIRIKNEAIEKALIYLALNVACEPGIDIDEIKNLRAELRKAREA